MKGLLIKDFKFMKIQKSFFILQILIGLVLSFANDPLFIVGFMPFACSMFVMTTIAFDEYDNGYEFLFTCPISRKDYVVEKYLFGIMIGGGAWIGAVIISMGIMWIQGQGIYTDFLWASFLIFPLMLLMLSILLPFDFKYGSSLSRIALFIAIGMVMIIGFGIVKLTEWMNIDILWILETFPSFNLEIYMIIFIVVTLIVLGISMKISEKILINKQF